MAGRSNPKDNRYFGKPDYRYDEATGRWFYKNNPSPIPTTGDLPWKDDAGVMHDPNSDTAPTPEELAEINRQAEGGVPTPGAQDYSVTGYGDPSGLNINLPSNAPGAELDVSQPNEERQRLTNLLAQLQTQATTGGGAWEQALQSSTNKAKGAASALGQGPGVDAMSAKTNIGEARAGAEQAAVGQGNILREQTKQQAQGDIANVLGQQSALDASQAGTQAATRQGVGAVRNAIRENANTANAGIYKGVGDAFMSVLKMAGASNGGSVGGEAPVSGDDSANDIVPTMLSPGEIVIPRSIAQGPDAAGRAAAFVAAIKAKDSGNKSHFDDGGTVPPPWKPGDLDPTNVNRQPGFLDLSIPVQPFAPDIAKGSMLDTTQYDETRKAALANADRLASSAAGTGPSVVPQQMQNTTDATLQAAMRAGASGKGAGRASGAGDIVRGATENIQQGAGEAAATAAGEQTKAGQQLNAALQRQRAQDLQMASSQQQAQWRNTMTNMGISLEKQQQLLNIIAGGGQAAMSVMQMFPELKSNSYGYDPGTQRYDTTPAYEDRSSSPSEWNSYPGQGSSAPIYDPDMGKAHGGEIHRARAFVQALAGGGEVKLKYTIGRLERVKQPESKVEGGKLKDVEEAAKKKAPQPTPDEWTPYEGREPRKTFGTVTEDDVASREFAKAFWQGRA